MGATDVILPISACLFESRMTYMSGRGTTVSTTSTPRRMQTPTTPRGGSSSPTLVGCWFASTPTSSRRAENWSCRTWRQIKWLCSRGGEQTLLRVCFWGLLLLFFSNVCLWNELKDPRLNDPSQPQRESTCDQLLSLQTVYWDLPALYVIIVSQ